MSDLPYATQTSQVSTSPLPALMHRNRLSIAHLLLWTAATGVVLAYLQTHKPPPPEEMHFASVLSWPGTTPEAELKKLQERYSRLFRTQHAVALAVSPVYGAALVGVALALWRLATRRFGFPVQPGHWLLMIIGSLALLVAAHPFVQQLPLSPDGADFVLATAMTGVVIVATVVAREPLHWRCPLALSAGGLGIIDVAYVIGFFSSSIEPPLIFPLGPFAIAGVPFVALYCTVLDVAEHRRYDVLHWVGVATLFGVTAHFLLLWAVARYNAN